MNEIQIKSELKKLKDRTDNDIIRRSRLSPGSTYVDVKGKGYSSIYLRDVLISCGNPLIGHICDVFSNGSCSQEYCEQFCIT